MVKRRKVIKATSGIGIAGLAGCSGGGGGDGDDYPSQDIRVIINWAEGGATDAYARQIVAVAHERLGVSSQFENIDGGGGLRGLTETYNSDPDGYTMGSISTPLIPLAALLEEPEVDVRDGEVIGGYSIGTFGVWTRPDLDINSFEDVLNRYQDGEFSVLGIQDEGDPTEVIARVLRNSDDVNWSWENIVGYGGSAETGRALTAGEVPVAIASDGGVRSFYDDGQIEAVVMLNSDGSSVYPDVPTITDEGYESHDYLAQFLRGMVFPPDTSNEIRDTMADAIQEATESDEVSQWEEESGNPVDYIPGDEFSQAVDDAYERIPEEVNLDELGG